MEWLSGSGYDRVMYAIFLNRNNTLSLSWRPDIAAKKSYISTVRVPRDKWFKLTTYYERSKTSAPVSVWLDDEQLFYVEGNRTVLNNGLFHFHIMNYGSGVGKAVIYVDDMTIEERRE